MTIVRHRRLIGIAVASVTLAGSIAPAQAAPNRDRAGAAVHGQNQRASSERQICARLQTTGSRLKQRICLSAAEWEREGGIPTKD